MTAFVVSGGELAGLERTGMAPVNRVEVAAGLAMTYQAIWKSQPQVRTVVSFLARNIAQIGLHSFERVSDLDRKRLTDHPLPALLSTPNPSTTRYRMIDSLVHDLGIFDNAFWLKGKADGQPRALWRIPPQLVTPEGGSWLTADGYKIKGTRGSRVVAAEDMVHFRGFNPDDPRMGFSPLETLRRILAEEYEAGLYRQSMWRGGARISGYLKRPAAAPGWSAEARDRFKRGWRAQYAGGGTDVGGTPILEDGMEFVSAAMTPEQAQYMEARKLTREEVAAAYFIPPPMVGILDHATFSNIAEQHKNLYQDTLGPWLAMIQDELGLQLVPDLDRSGKVYVEFNLAEKLRGSFEEQAAAMQTMVGGPVLTRNEGRARLNLPQIPGGDELIVPLNVIIGGQASPTDSAPKSVTVGVPAGKAARVSGKADEADEADSLVDRYTGVLTAFFGRQGAAVLSALGAGVALTDAWDAERWTKELTDDLHVAGVDVAAAAAALVLAALDLPADGYSSDRADGWLRANAEGVAEAVNDTTLEQLRAAEEHDDPPARRAQVFATAAAARALQVARSQATAVAGFGKVEAVTQQGLAATKTWHAGSTPRASHARLDGETVPVGEVFSNGARWPGDSRLAPAERAGCNCRMTIGLEAP